MRNTLIVLTVLLVILLVSCNPKPENYVVATVNGQPILLGDIMKSKQFQSVVMEEVRKRKFQEWARMKNIKIDENKVNAKYEEERNKYGSDKEWEEFLRVRGFTPESAKKMLRDLELQYAIALSKADPITDEVVLKNWKDQKSWWQSVVANELKATKNINKEPEKIEFEEAKDFIKKTLEDQAASSHFQEALNEIDEYFIEKGSVVLNYLPIEERRQIAREERNMLENKRKQQKELERRQKQVMQRGEDVKAETGGAVSDNNQTEANKQAETKKDNKETTQNKENKSK